MEIQLKMLLFFMKVIHVISVVVDDIAMYSTFVLDLENVFYLLEHHETHVVPKNAKS